MIWFLMKVIPRTHCVHSIRYLRFSCVYDSNRATIPLLSRNYCQCVLHVWRRTDILFLLNNHVAILWDTNGEFTGIRQTINITEEHLVHISAKALESQSLYKYYKSNKTPTTRRQQYNVLRCIYKLGFTYYVICCGVYM